MSYAPITIAARRVLLNALEALEEQRDGLVLVGAQAIYLYTGDTDVAIATRTEDSDLAIVPSRPRRRSLKTRWLTRASRTTARRNNPASGRLPRRTTHPSTCSFQRRSTRVEAAAGHESHPTPSTRRGRSPDSRRRR